MQSDSQELLRRASEGDEEAVRDLVSRFERPVRAMIRRKLGTQLRRRVDTDDLFQSTVLAAVAGLPDFRYQGEGALRGWLLEIAERKVKMVARYHRAQRRDLRRIERIRTSFPVPVSATAPGDRVARQEEVGRLMIAMESLEPGDRKVLELRSFEGLAFRAIAERLGLRSEDAARQRFRRAFRRLGDQLDE